MSKILEIKEMKNMARLIKAQGVFAVLLLSVMLPVSAQYKMVVYTNGGTRTEFWASSVDSVTWEYSEPYTPVDSMIHVGYEYVDLGLSVKWATMNVGAAKPEDYGYYFAWSETEPRTEYNWTTYKYCKGSRNTITKYCDDSDYGNDGFTDNKSILDLDDDAAHVNWGGSWRMPTLEEMKELIDNCTWIWTTMNGYNGYKVQSNQPGYTDNWIFLPASGCRYNSLLSNEGSYGYYWSSTLSADYSRDAYGLVFFSNNIGWYYNYRYNGYSVRPVCP